MIRFERPALARLASDAYLPEALHERREAAFSDWIMAAGHHRLTPRVLMVKFGSLTSNSAQSLFGWPPLPPRSTARQGRRRTTTAVHPRQ